MAGTPLFRCPACRHHLCSREVSSTFYVKKQKTSTLLLPYQCALCRHKGTAVFPLTACKGRHTTYQEVYRAILRESFSPENSDQLAFDTLNRTPITSAEVEDFRTYTETCHNILHDIRLSEDGR